MPASTAVSTNPTVWSCVICARSGFAMEEAILPEAILLIIWYVWLHFNSVCNDMRIL